MVAPDKQGGGAGGPATGTKPSVPPLPLS
jgi:hypothetical protein